MKWYDVCTDSGRMTLCERCARHEPHAEIADDAVGCDLCGRQVTDDDETEQIRQALHLARAQLELAEPLLTQRRQRNVLMKNVDYELHHSYTKADAEWKARSRRLLAFVRTWLDRCDLSEDGPSNLKGGDE